MQKPLLALSFTLAAVLLLGTGCTAAKSQNPSAATMSATQSTSSGLASGEAKRLNASGATFPLELYKKWNAEYKTLTGVEINYAGGGSGQGKKDIQAQAVDFAGSDSFMNDAELKAAKGGEL